MCLSRARSACGLTFIGLWIFFQSTGSMQSQNNPPRWQVLEGFLTAIQMGDTNAAAALLESNTNLAFATENLSKAPLLEAAAAGNVALVKRMLQLGADINVTGDTRMSGGSQMTALHEAIKYNQPAVCQSLLESGANPNVTAFGFVTPLDLAFSENREEMAGWLLDYGAEPFEEKPFTNEKTTPFELAITRSSGRLTARMLGQEPQHQLGTKSLQKPSQIKNSRRVIRTAPEILSAHGGDLLAAAAARGELEAVQALIKAGVMVTNASPDNPPILQSFALSAADATSRRTSVIEQWRRAQDAAKRDYGARADSKYVASLHAQESALAEKAEALAPERWQKILELLIEHGADYDAFAATALGDTNRMTRLVSASQQVAQGRDHSGQTPLFWAVNADSSPLVSFWIQAGAPLAATNCAGQTALHVAAVSGKTELVKTLLAAQSPANIRDTNGWTPLDAAIQAKQSECIHLLLADKSAPLHQERGFAGPLHAVAASGNIVALASVLETETNLEARNELGLTPLQIAVIKGHLAAAALLVDKGADLNVRDPEGNSMLHQIFLQDRFIVYDRPRTNWVAALRENPQKETFIKYLTVSRYEQGPNPVLQGASFLLACGLDAQATNHAGQTVMQLITEEKISRGVFFFEDDREKLFKLLGGAGVNINERDAAGDTLLHRSVNKVDGNAVEELASLIAGGADINATNHLGQTPLHKAAEEIGGWDENTPAVNEPFQLLLYHKANVNVQDNQGLTPLHVLAAADTSFKREATQALLDAGANPKLRDKHGRTPAHLFLSGKWPWRESGDCLAMLVKAGADLGAKDDEGKTPLHYLAALGDQHPMFFIRGIKEVFATAKVDFKARDNSGNTALHIAAKTGTSDVFDWLVSQGAGLDETNNAGETPRLISAHSSKGFSRSGPPDAQTDIFVAAREGKLEPLSALLKADPKLANATNQSGLTPLRFAVLSHRTNAIEFLEQHGAQWDIISAVLDGKTQALREILARAPGEIAAKNYGNSLLHLAAVSADLETTRILLDAGADLRAKETRGLTPLGTALLQKHPEVAAALRQRGAAENIFDAAYTGGLEEAASLIITRDNSLALGTNAAGVSALEIAAATGQAGILKLFLENSAPATYVNIRDGRTPLHAAAIYNRTNTATLLIEHGAKVNAPDLFGFTPLHLAALLGASDTAALLLKNKADPTLPTAEPSAESRLRLSMMAGPESLIFNQDTALHLAAAMCQTNLIRLLLASGAAVNMADGMERTPLDLAKRPGMSPNVFWIQRGIGRVDPLGTAEPPPLANRAALLEQQKVAADLLEKAGGKQQQPTQRNGRPPGY